MANERHCATCRCAVTVTGQIAAFLEINHQSHFTCEQIAKRLGFKGGVTAMRSTLDRMVREGKILRTGKAYSARPETIDDLRVWVKESGRGE